MRAYSQHKRYTRTRFGNAVYLIFLLLAGLFTVLPMVYSVLTSFKPLDELMIFPPRFFVVRPTVSNYFVLPNLIANLRVPLSRYVLNSFAISLFITFFHVVIASMAAFVLSKTQIRGKTVIFLIIQFSLLYNAYTLAVPQYVIFSKLRIIDTYLVYIIPYLPAAIGVFLMKQYIDTSIPDTLLEAARIDGAGYFRSFWSLVMPVVKPAWLTLSLFAFRDAWMLQPQGTIFSEELKTLPYVLSQITMGGITRAGSAMAATTLMMIPPILVYLISQSSVMETMSSAGIKE